MRTEIPAPTRDAPEGTLTILGATTCEDTALVRSRLSALAVPFAELDVDIDAAAKDRLARLHDGALITPTLITAASPGGDVRILAEPTLEQLGALLRDLGVRSSRPAVTQFHRPTIERPIPTRTLETSRGEGWSIESLRGRRQVALLLGHDAGCLACMGYAKQLARQAAGLAEADGVAVAAVTPAADAGSFDGWHHEIRPELTILVDPDGAWKRSVLARLGQDGDGTALLMLDRWAAPRAGSFAPEAGGLADPSEATEWLAYLALECPECSTELPWPAGSGG